MKKLPFMIMLLVFIATTVAASVMNMPETNTDTNTNNKQEEFNEICDILEEEGEPEQVAVGPHVKIGKAAEWIIANSNKPDGWSFSGYAKLRIHSDSNFSRLKMGIINGELDCSEYQEIDTFGYRKLDEWNQRKNKGIIFGIVFTREF